MKTQQQQIELGSISVSPDINTQSTTTTTTIPITTIITRDPEVVIVNESEGNGKGWVDNGKGINNKENLV